MNTYVSHVWDLTQNVFASVNIGRIIGLEEFEKEIDPWDEEDESRTSEEESVERVPFPQLLEEPKTEEYDTEDYESER